MSEKAQIMTQKFAFDSDDFVIESAVVASHQDYFFVAHHVPSLDQGNYRTHLLRCANGEWSELARWPWHSVGLVVPSLSPLRVEVLGRDGEIGVLAGERISQENLEPGTAIGPMRKIEIVFGRVMAYGMQRHIFVRETSGRWIRLDRGMAEEVPADDFDIDTAIRRGIKSSGGINAIVSYQKDRLLAFGLRGEVWRFLVDTWKQMDSPTNAMLKDAVSGPDGDIYVVGLRGTLLKGHDNYWQQVDYRGPGGLGFCSVNCFQNRIYVADGHSLRVLADGDLNVIDFGVEEIVPCMQIATGADEIMSVAGQEIWVSLDGIKWRTVVG